MDKPIWIDVWYNWEVRSWCVQGMDENNNQWEDVSTYVYSKEESEQIELIYIEYYNIDIKYSRKRKREYRKYLKSEEFKKHLKNL